MERRAITSQEGTLSHKFHFGKLLCSAGLALFTTQGICSEAREISLSAGEEPFIYSEVIEAVAETTGWKEEDDFAIRMTKVTGDGAVYAVYSAEYSDALDGSAFAGQGEEGGSVVIYPKKLTIESADVGIAFVRTDETDPGLGSLVTDCDVYIKAPTVIKEDGGVIGTLRFTARDPANLRSEESAWTPTVNLTGDYRFSEGRLEFDSVNATIIGEGSIGTLALNETIEGHKATLHITEDPASAKRSFLRAEELELSSGILKVTGSGTGTGFGSVFQAINLSSLREEPSESSIEVSGNGALVLGEVPVGDRDVSFVGEEVIRLLGESKVAGGAIRPTLVTSNTTPRVSLPEGATLTIKVGSVDSATSTGSNASILFGSDARWVVLCGEDASPRLRSVGTNFSVASQEGAELVISGWSGEDLNLGITWNPDYVRFKNTTLGRAEAVLTDSGIRITRQLMQELPSLKSRNAVKIAEDGLYAGTLASPGVEFIREAIGNEKIGKDIFADFVDSSVFLPFSSGTLVLSERAFDATHANAMTRPIVRTTERTHWWASASREKHRIPASNLKGTVTTASFGFDRTFNENWTGSLAVTGIKVDSHTKAASSSINGDATVALASLALERKLFSDSALRFGLTVGQSEAEAKRIGLSRRLKTEPKMKLAGVGLQFATHFGSAKWAARPFLGANGYYAKIEDGEVIDSGENSGIYGTGFKTQAKARSWADITAGISAETSWEPFVDCFIRPRLSLIGKAAFGDRDWKATARLATEGAAADYDQFHSTARWSVRAEVGLNIASSSKVPIKQGGFFGIGGKDTGKEEMRDWHLDLKFGYRRAAASEHSTYARLEYRENW